MLLLAIVGVAVHMHLSQEPKSECFRSESCVGIGRGCRALLLLSDCENASRSQIMSMSWENAKSASLNDARPLAYKS
eukprot:243854-Amphidinium_carterae.2